MKKFIIPLKVIELDTQSFHVIAEADINGIPLNLIIDTGASRTVFDGETLENFLRKAETYTKSIQSAGLMADKIESKMAIADHFVIGGLRLTDFPVILIDMNAIKDLYIKVTGTTIHGLLGSDFLLKMKSTIDYKKLELVLRY